METPYFRTEEEWKKAREMALGLFKFVYYGSFGNEKGEGCLYFNEKDGVFQDKIEFATNAEGEEVLEKKLFELSI